MPAESIGHWDKDALYRSTESLAALILTLQKRPLIRYMASSPMTYQLARSLSDMLKEDPQLFSFPRVCDTAPILLLLDRSIDPITPLLIPWSYQSMLHEFFNIKDDRILLDEQDEENQQPASTNTGPIALSFQESRDPFFSENRLKYYGDVGLALKTYIQEFFDMRGKHLKIESLSEMKRFTEQHGQFSEREANVQKHVKLLEKLHNVVDHLSLYEISEFEQSLVSATLSSASGKKGFGGMYLGLENNASVDPEAEIIISQLKSLLSKKLIHDDAMKFKLAVLSIVKLGIYSSRTFSEIKQLFPDLTNEQIEFLDSLRRIFSILDIKIECDASGSNSSAMNIFKDSIFTRARQAFSSGIKDDVELVYTRHKPQLQQVIELLIKGKLSDKQFPFFDQPVKEKPKEAIIFLINGVTFEEMRLVSLYNAQELGSSLLIGGTCILNSSRSTTKLSIQMPTPSRLQWRCDMLCTALYNETG
ncbi:Sec1/Munc18-like (SM) protein [Mitosporidium daphniae]|uniref:Sec1/Munc18-like (SM) protein n=1 Tax=Mitosporidium daphniae TaxID=1485682 RepID=A0A098VSW0_9MICR|nr:Sec1/Munc18-like (SM) protein [Mitosporidium daphniae]KGG52087.1 Sec1/Munc18-like (SM) protein [Mitosporidium daphniae]|eukprot:XP_013238545.1 Sec1/Munc18-like (SM) protein [Mitosporidium daphniae]